MVFEKELDLTVEIVRAEEDMKERERERYGDRGRERVRVCV